MPQVTRRATEVHTGPVPIPELTPTRNRWQRAAEITGVIAVGTLIAAGVILR